MLTTYTEMFGRRITARARIISRRVQMLDLCWFLDVVDLPKTSSRPLTPPSRPLSRKKLRKHRKMAPPSSAGS
ncbi:hypothetical protein F5Y05DRAFT_388223, partial [Hypoxylon sp. FL0543]